jgi:hypothetical protein
MPASTSIAATAEQNPTLQPVNTALHDTTPLAPGILVTRGFTAEETTTPWILLSGLSIEEHPLANRPEIDPLVIHPLDSLTQAQVLDKHKDEWEKTLPPNEYYSVGRGNLWVMQGNDKLEPVWGITENGKVTAQVTRNGNVFFSKLIEPPGTTSPFRVLTTYDDHWVFEIAKAKTPPSNNQDVDSFFSSEIFVDGQSLNDHHGYEESYGFQTLHGRPFYFYKRESKIGIFYDGQETDLGYDGLLHYGCCSSSALNPRMAQNIIGFFARGGDQWYYTEIGVFDLP